MMRRRKAPDPNAPPRDNGLPPQPEGLKEAKASLEKSLPGTNVCTGFGFPSAPLPKGAKREAAWMLFVFSDDGALKVPADHAGFPVERRGVPKAGPAKFHHR